MRIPPTVHDRAPAVVVTVNKLKERRHDEQMFGTVIHGLGHNPISFTLVILSDSPPIPCDLIGFLDWVIMVESQDRISLYNRVK